MTFHMFCTNNKGYTYPMLLTYVAVAASAMVEEATASAMVEEATDVGGDNFQMNSETMTHYLRSEDKIQESDNFDRMLTTDNSNSSSDSFTCEFPAEDCSNHGSCNKEGNDCVCNDGYLTFPNETTTDKCSYKQKQQLIAFGLEFFFGLFGGGSWYLGRSNYALIKISVLWLAPCGMLILGILYACFCSKESTQKKKNSDNDGCADFIGGIWKFTLISWWLADWIMIAINDVKDGNGAAMESW